MTFYCEQATGFSSDFGFADEGYLNSLLRMFDQALQLAAGLAAEQRGTVLERLKLPMVRAAIFTVQP